MQRRHFLAAAFGVAPGALWAQQGATDWPNRASKLLVGFPAGQGSDVLARIYAAELQKETGQAFVVDNRPGVGATLAARDAAKSAPDGYTLLYTSGGPLTVAPHLYQNLGFDPMRDLDFVALIGRSPLLLLVRADSPIKTLPELVAASKRKELNCGSGGNGVTNHLALEMFKIASGARLLHVPYKGAAPAMTDLMGGQIDTMFETSSAALIHVRAGRLRALATTSPTRYSELPDVPTVADFYPGFEAMTWAALAVPRGMPAPIVDKLAALMGKMQDDPSVRVKMMQAGIEPMPGSTPAKTRAYVLAEYEKWGNIIRRANVKLD